MHTMVYCDNGEQATRVTNILSDMGWWYGDTVPLPVSVLHGMFQYHHKDTGVYLLLNQGTKRLEGISRTPLTRDDAPESGIPIYPAITIAESYNDH